MPHEPLRDDETLIEARWTDIAAGPEGDEIEARIQRLIAHDLIARGSSADGWDWLFEDPRDGRLWELTFPLGSLHGSGPRRLAVITNERAAEKYALRRSSDTDSSE